MIRFTVHFLNYSSWFLCEQSAVLSLVSKKCLVVGMPRKLEGKPESRLWLASTSLYSTVCVAGPSQADWAYFLKDDPEQKNGLKSTHILIDTISVYILQHNE